VAIQLQRGLKVVVPEALAHSHDVDSRFEEQRGVGVMKARSTPAAARLVPRIVIILAASA
jgi:hypothetical protein